MTKFEFFVYKLLGDAAHSDGDGVSCWDCPACGRGGKKFHTMPPKQGYKDRVKCYRCGLCEDIHGLMRLVREEANFPREQADLNQWKKEYERLHGGDRDEGRDTHPSFPPRGCGVPAGEATPDEVVKFLLAVGDLEWLLSEGMEPMELIRLLVAHMVFRHSDDHMAHCADEQCNSTCCRLARGWHPETIRRVNEGVRAVKERTAARKRRGTR